MPPKSRRGGASAVAAPPPPPPPPLPSVHPSTMGPHHDESSEIEYLIGRQKHLTWPVRWALLTLLPNGATSRRLTIRWLLLPILRLPKAQRDAFLDTSPCQMVEAKLHRWFLRFNEPQQLQCVEGMRQDILPFLIADEDGAGHVQLAPSNTAEAGGEESSVIPVQLTLLFHGVGGGAILPPSGGLADDHLVDSDQEPPEPGDQPEEVPHPHGGRGGARGRGQSPPPATAAPLPPSSGPELQDPRSARGRGGAADARSSRGLGQSRGRGARDAAPSSSSSSSAEVDEDEEDETHILHDDENEHDVTARVTRDKAISKVDMFIMRLLPAPQTTYDRNDNDNNDETSSHDESPPLRTYLPVRTQPFWFGSSRVMRMLVHEDIRFIIVDVVGYVRPTEGGDDDDDDDPEWGEDSGNDSDDGAATIDPRDAAQRRRPSMERLEDLLEQTYTVAGEPFNLLCCSNQDARQGKAVFAQLSKHQCDVYRRRMEANYDAFLFEGSESAKLLAKCFRRAAVSPNNMYRPIVRPEQWRELPDVTIRPQEHPSNLRTLTDGCGYVRRSWLVKILEENGFTFPPLKKYPLRFRFQGKRGVMMTLEDEDFIKLIPPARGIPAATITPVGTTAAAPPPVVLLFRPSQEKFKATSLASERQRLSDAPTFGICSVGMTKPLYLCREILTLLTDAIPRKKRLVFQKHVMDLALKAADNIVRECSPFGFMYGDTTDKFEKGHIKYNHQLQECTSIEDAVNYVNPQEPWSHMMRRCSYAYKMFCLVVKFRIFVPDGCRVMGVADPFGTLRDGEVYLAAKEFDNSAQVDRKVIIYKKPSLHPGDLRVVTVKPLPQLYVGCYNMIIFPSRSDCRRCVQNECSGGTVGGDEYDVIWDKEFLKLHQFPKTSDYSNFDDVVDQDAYSNVHRVKAPTPAAYVARCLTYGGVGGVSKVHAVVCDVERYDRGSRSDVAIQLARCHSVSMQFPKTGIVPLLPKDARFVSAKQRPDFLLPRRPRARVYKSNALLGKLHRLLKGFLNRSDPGRIEQAALEAAARQRNGGSKKGTTKGFKPRNGDQHDEEEKLNKLLELTEMDFFDRHSADVTFLSPDETILSFWNQHVSRGRPGNNDNDDGDDDNNEGVAASTTTPEGSTWSFNNKIIFPLLLNLRTLRSQFVAHVARLQRQFSIKSPMELFLSSAVGCEFIRDDEYLEQCLDKFHTEWQKKVDQVFSHFTSIAKSKFNWMWRNGSLTPEMYVAAAWYLVGHECYWHETFCFGLPVGGAPATPCPAAFRGGRGGAAAGRGGWQRGSGGRGRGGVKTPSTHQKTAAGKEKPGWAPEWFAHVAFAWLVAPKFSLFAPMQQSAAGGGRGVGGGGRGRGCGVKRDDMRQKQIEMYRAKSGQLFYRYCSDATKFAALAEIFQFPVRSVTAVEEMIPALVRMTHDEGFEDNLPRRACSLIVLARVLTSMNWGDAVANLVRSYPAEDRQKDFLTLGTTPE